MDKSDWKLAWKTTLNLIAIVFVVLSFSEAVRGDFRTAREWLMLALLFGLTADK